jgi:hypothetical protein
LQLACQCKQTPPKGANAALARCALGGAFAAQRQALAQVDKSWRKNEPASLVTSNRALLG